MMTAVQDRPSAALLEAVARDAHPVRPLARPWLRALLLLPPGLVLLVALPLILGVRMDASAVGLVRLWAASAVQTVLGIALVTAALREAVPGRSRSWSNAALALFALAWVLGLTLLTWHASNTVVPHGREARFWIVCFAGPLTVALPALALCLVLASRAFPLRPALVGTFAGMGAGLLADSGWRTFCQVSDPAHVVSAHIAAVVALTLVGAVVARFALRDR
jgi:hypothetical protein